MTSKLNTSLPTMVPSPKLEWVTNNETSVHNNSGMDAPAAMSVAPDTSSGMRYKWASTSMAGTRRDSVITPCAQRDIDAMMAWTKHDDVDDGSILC
jgi:hypothetical protein